MSAGPASFPSVLRVIKGCRKHVCTVVAGPSLVMDATKKKKKEKKRKSSLGYLEV